MSVDTVRRGAGGGPGLLLGIDIGGTFTDVTVHEPVTGHMVSYKSPTDPGDPAAGVARALALLPGAGIAAQDVSYFVHGSTIALNSVIERSGARVALLTTEGFRDILELARLRLPVPFDFYSERPRPLVPRERVVAVHERMRHDGSAATELSAAEIDRVTRVVAELDVDAVAICLLHSYANAAHEGRLRDALREHLPALFVTCSGELWPEFREYERSMVTVINAYVGPAMAAYTSALEAEVTRASISARPYLTRSNGGIMTLSAARAEAVHTLQSGPAAGVTGALDVALRAGLRHVVTLDVGGTSADIAVLADGRPHYSRTETVGDFPVYVPAIAISSIGAGGGSIAWLDPSGALKVGPRSAGAVPGPACYGLGGLAPTLTDAFLANGYLSPDNFAGGIQLRPDLALSSLRSIGERMGAAAEVVADGIMQVALANMYTEFSGAFDRVGADPRQFTLVAFGGAGPVLGCLLADEVSVARVLFPESPGTLCAFGALKAHVMSDFVHTINIRAEDGIPAQVSEVAQRLAARARDWLAQEAPPVADRTVQFSADMRYAGQSHDLEVPASAADLLAGDLSAAVRAFHAIHDDRYNFSNPGASVEVVNIRCRALGTMAWPSPEPAPLTSGTAPAAGQRPIRYHGRQVAAAVYHRSQLRPGHRIGGPAIVGQSDTTVLIPPRWSARVDGYRNLLAQREQ